MSNFIIYAMCPHCLVMHGPFASDAQRGNFYDTVHSVKCVGERQIPKEHRGKIQSQAAMSEQVVPVKTERTYVKGDASRAFGSGYAGSCYQCGFGYEVGDFIRMVTVRDGEKGKAVHEGCADELLDLLFDKRIQDDEPPF